MMRSRSLFAMMIPAILSACAPSAAEQRDERSLAWAYPIPPAAAPAIVGDTANLLTIPGSTIRFRRSEVTNLFSAPDWKPSEHPPMPPVVAYGRKPDVMACAYCHLPTGDGRPENAPLAGLPRDYIVEQMKLFRDGSRGSSVSGRAPTTNMIRTAKAMTDAEIEDAAEYFSTLHHRSFVRVVEASSVPKSLTKAWLYSRDPAGGAERLGQRILEMPEDFERFERRDPAVPYTAYVPVGSIKRGEALVRNWGKGAQACAACHGAGLRGEGDVPPLAGRSPTYIARQLNDFRTGARRGGAADQMVPVVASMREQDMIAIAAYIGAQRP